jgi:hypothetical protein
MNDLDPRTIFTRLLRFWWVLSLAMILGGMTGWVFSRIHPPVYEATAYYQVNLDEQGLIKRLGLPPQTDLDFLTVNPYLTPVADQFYSPGIREQVIAALEGEDIHLAPADFNTRNFILDRRGLVWFITARDSDPDRAVKMADIWLRTIDGHLHELQAHAVHSRVLKLQYLLVERCFTDFSFTEANQCAGTSFSSLSELDAFLNGLVDQIAAEDASSRGIDPLLSFVIERPAVATAAPLLYARSNLMVAGGLVGLLIAIALVFDGKGTALLRK